MQIAYYINNNGEKIELSANDYECIRYSGRIFCPLCGEHVDWIKGYINKKHFKHHHGTYKQECENYCSSISVNRNIHPYAIVGLPIYLIKELNSYSLAIGFYGIEESTIEEAEKINLELEIEINENSKIIRKVNSQYFVPNKISIIKLDAVKQQYRLKFSQLHVPKEIELKWAKAINGIGNNGAIFYCGSHVGKKVGSADGILVNEEYLLFTSINFNKRKISGILLELKQEINFGWLRTYKIYKLVIKKLTQETIEFCNLFDMNLKYSKPNIIPIWPPCIIFEQELVYGQDCNKFFILNSDNEKDSNVYSYGVQKKLRTQKICCNKYFVESNVKYSDFISLGSLKNNFIFSITKKNLDNKTKIPDIEISIKSGNVRINANVKVFINHFIDSILTISSLLTNMSDKDVRIKKNEEIEIVYGLDVIKLVTGHPKTKQLQNIFEKDNEFLNKIKKCKGEQIVVPDNFKWMALKQKKYRQSYMEINKLIKSNNVTIELINLLKNNV